MGRCKVNMQQNLMDLLATLEENTDQICINAINEALPTAEKTLKEECAKHNISKYDKTKGELVESIKVFSAKKNKYGTFGGVGPTGEDSKGVKNGLKLGILEYGKEGQPSTPVCTPAANRIEGEVEELIQKSIERQAGL